jgi:hypothetical protein
MSKMIIINEFRFLNPENITLTDCQGKEVKIPFCKECKNPMAQMIGKEYYAWVCIVCPVEHKFYIEKEY